MKQTHTSIIMIGLTAITFLIVLGWIMSPTNFSISLDLDDDAVKVSENMINITDRTCIEDKDIRCKYSESMKDCYFIIQ